MFSKVVWKDRVHSSDAGKRKGFRILWAIIIGNSASVGEHLKLKRRIRERKKIQTDVLGSTASGTSGLMGPFHWEILILGLNFPDFEIYFIIQRNTSISTRGIPE